MVNYSQWQIVSPEASLASLPCVDGYKMCIRDRYDDMMGGYDSPDIKYVTIDGERYRPGSKLRDRVGPAITYNLSLIHIFLISEIRME